MTRLTPVLLTVLCVVAVAASAGAQTAYSGDANRDDRLDVADLLTINDFVTTPTLVNVEDFPYADADQNEQIDAEDSVYMINVLLGIWAAKPLAGPPTTTIVSFWFQEPVSSFAITDQTLQPARASFWFQTPPASVSIGEQDIHPARASFWFQTSPAMIAIGDEDIHPARASFWFQPTVPGAMDVDAVVLGTPSFERQ